MRRERRRGLIRDDVRFLETRGEVPRRPGAKSRSASNWLRRRERAWEHVLEERYDEETVSDVRRELRGLIRVLVIEQELREGPALRRVLGDQARSHKRRGDRDRAGGGLTTVLRIDRATS